MRTRFALAAAGIWCAAAAVAQFEITEVERSATVVLLDTATLTPLQQSYAYNTAQHQFSAFLSATEPTAAGEIYASMLQHSFVEPMGFLGDGGGGIEWEGAEDITGFASTLMRVAFTVASPFTVRVKGWVDHTDVRAQAHVQLGSDPWSSWIVSAHGLSSEHFDQTLALTPGEYELLAAASVFSSAGDGTAWADWRLELTVVPEPATCVALLGSFIIFRRRAA